MLEPVLDMLFILVHPVVNPITGVNVVAENAKASVFALFIAGNVTVGVPDASDVIAPPSLNHGFDKSQPLKESIPRVLELIDQEEV